MTMTNIETKELNLCKKSKARPAAAQGNLAHGNGTTHGKKFRESSIS
jgi:hypothetical protein